MNKINNDIDLLAEDIKLENRKRNQLINLWKKKLRGLINVSGLLNHLNETTEYWTPIDIVDIYLVNERLNGYSLIQHARIYDDDDKLLYLKSNETEIRKIDHCFVWQTTGHGEDDYSGYLLFPLNNEKYFKVYYSL